MFIKTPETDTFLESLFRKKTMEVDPTKINDIMSYLSEIQIQIAELKEDYKNKIKHEYQSPETNDLFTALSKSKAEMPIVKATKINPYFGSHYADLCLMIHQTTPALSKHGLSIIQQIITEEGQSILHTILAHSSGQWIKSTQRINPSKTDIKTIQSYTDFMKKLSYSSLVGIALEGNDDDGEIEMSEARVIVSKGPSNKYDPKKESFEAITREQIEELEYELAEYPDLAESILDGLRIQSLADMPKSQYGLSIRRIREIKQLRNGK